MTRRFIRPLALIFALLAAVGLSVVMAAPAQAGVAQCTQYLSQRGYIIGQRVIGACTTAQNSGMLGVPVCIVLLTQIGVATADATPACQLARN